MKKELYRKIEIPEDVEAEVDGTTFKVKGPEGENSREFKIGKLDFKKEGDKIVIGYKKATKNEKKLMNTISAHIENMIKGAKKKFEYQLLGCYSHFPITIEIKGDEATIKNFLGEKIPRKTKIPEGAEIEIGKDSDKKVPITIKSIDKEIAGQAAANFETATKVKGRDRRVFQDGIFITNKAGREM